MLSILLKVIDESRKASHLIPIDEVNLPRLSIPTKVYGAVIPFPPPKYKLGSEPRLGIIL